MLYSYGFSILVLGAATSFLGGAMPESARPIGAALRIFSLFAFLIVVLALAVVLAPLLIQ